MGKRSSRELVGHIAGALTSDPQSIQSISDAVDADRQSVTKYLEELEDAGIVKEDKSGRTREFYVSEYEDNESYFELPLKNEEKEKFKVLFKKILGEYRERFGETPGKLMYQKIAVNVINELGLDLPIGRYQYGSITAMNFTPGDANGVGPVDFGPGFSEDQVDEAVENSVSEWGELGFHEAREKQYEKEDMELYQEKEEIMKALATDDVGPSFQKNLYSFLAKTPELDDEVEEDLVDFIAVAPDLVDHPMHRAKVMETFKEVWELIAFYCLQEDMAKHYDEEVVRSRTEKERLEKKDEVEQALTELISLHEEVKDYEVSEEMQTISGEEISDEEKERREEELEDMNSSDVARKFDLES
jgi:DNA-binding transcriptional ArsR family regulator